MAREERNRGRRLDLHGRPECVPFLPSEFLSRRAELGLVDPSATPLAQSSVDDFDPIERIRLRQLIERNPTADKPLLSLSDEELDGALGLAQRVEGRLAPTVAGLLLVGMSAAIRMHVPSHEVAFQVFDGTDLRVNEFLRWPLLHAFERLDEMFTARLEEQEVMIGPYRLGIPRVDRAAFREAMANAMVHRDYARFGAVHVQWERDELRISSPGGFVTGVTVGNLLVTPPKARNPLLADAFKRIGLVERSGRGVDRIYEGVLRCGRPAPDYSGSDNTGVTVRLSTADADVAFFRMIYDAEKRRGALHRAEVLVALSTLRELRRASEDDIAARMQRSGAAARAVLEELVETGLVAPQGSNRDRVYTLSSTVYSQLDKRAEYIRQVGFDGLQKEQMILAWVREHGHIKRPDVVELCRVSERQASRILETLVREGRLHPEGAKRWTRYLLP